MNLVRTYRNPLLELFEGELSSDHMEALSLVPRMYNRLLGPITSLLLHRPDILDAAFYASACSHSPLGYMIKDLSLKSGITDTIRVPGGGKGSHTQQCSISGLAELSERLFAVFHAISVGDQLVSGSYRGLVSGGVAAISPQALPLFAPEQYRSTGFPYVPFAEDQALNWIEGERLLSGEKVLVPAQLICMHYPRRAGEPNIGYSTSGGLTFHTNRQQGILHGICEVIERDAINLRWHCRMYPPKVELDLRSMLHDDLGSNHVRLSSAFVSEPTIHLNTVDLDLPVFTATARIEGKERTFLGAGGAAMSRSEALGQALLELGQTRAALSRYGEWGKSQITPSTSVRDLEDFLDSTIYYGLPENSHHLSYFEQGGRVDWHSTPNAPIASYPAMLDWLKEAHLNPVVFDLGPGPPGVFITKVFIPQLTQANQPALPFLGHPRYRDVPVRLGQRTDPMKFDDLNRMPVPLP